ncbi:MFS general substrate transporter [Cucurbitaria berberidis CBS 394.84]|uniref:MFS general substrate transporter n=1 Tax=Cucurbitaria berberidis CBS 394.84 TaxID=1168544 RepID=A0A9P4GJ03_9PLEO|nr:MFS general substrate transporter [Cucurbitaria berberidis CBS 394.84]KAF1847083.1 MFS general substrate transporter [Cucurbitaria berberidis CBS 394.84]
MAAEQQTKDESSTSVVEERPGIASEALRKLWTPRALGCAIGCLLVMNFFMNMTVYTQNVYEPYATSHFDRHSLLATGSIINGIVRIVAYPLLAKLADHFGRPLGFAGGALSMALGNVMFAACRNVDTFLAGGIFDSLGDAWWNITQQIFVADVTSLVNRGILFTLPESLTAIPTLYGGSYLGEHMLDHSTWRWGYGMWAIVLPVTAIPTIVIMLWMGRRAKHMGLIRERLSLMHGAPSGVFGKTKHIVTQLDIIGAFLLIAGLAMTLLPMTIAGRNNTHRWEKPSSIVLLIIGVLTFIAFLVWDGKFAPNPIVPYRTIKERNVIVACVTVIIIATSDSIYRPFLSSFLQVAGHYSPGAAIRVDNAQRVAYNIGALVCGLSLKYVKQTKPFTILGVVLIILASGLPIYLTNISGTHIASEAAFITSKSLLGVGRGFAQVSLQVALQAVLENDQIAVATAVYLSSLGFGSNLGVTISGAMWNSLLPSRLDNHFNKAESKRIFGSIVVAKKYKIGSTQRNLIDKCYRETQQRLAIGSICVSGILLVIVFFARNVKLGEEDAKRAEKADEELAYAIKAKDGNHVEMQAR